MSPTGQVPMLPLARAVWSAAYGAAYAQLALRDTWVSEKTLVSLASGIADAAVKGMVVK